MISSDSYIILWRSLKSSHVGYKSSLRKLLFPYLLSLTRNRNVIATEWLISFSSILLASSLLSTSCYFIMVGGICSLRKAVVSGTLDQVASLYCDRAVAENSHLWKSLRFLSVSLFIPETKMKPFISDWLLFVCFLNREVISKFLVPNRKFQVWFEKSCQNLQEWVT